MKLSLKTSLKHSLKDSLEILLKSVMLVPSNFDGETEEHAIAHMPHGNGLATTGPVLPWGFRMHNDEPRTRKVWAGRGAGYFYTFLWEVLQKMRKLNLEIRTVDIKLLKPAAYNPRRDLKPGDAEYEKLLRDMNYIGRSFRYPSVETFAYRHHLTEKQFYRKRKKALKEIAWEIYRRWRLSEKVSEKTSEIMA